LPAPSLCPVLTVAVCGARRGRRQPWPGLASRLTSRRRGRSRFAHGQASSPAVASPVARRLARRLARRHRPRPSPVAIALARRPRPSLIAHRPSFRLAAWLPGVSRQHRWPLSAVCPPRRLPSAPFALRAVCHQRRLPSALFALRAVCPPRRLPSAPRPSVAEAISTAVTISTAAIGNRGHQHRWLAALRLALVSANRFAPRPIASTRHWLAHAPFINIRPTLALSASASRWPNFAVCSLAALRADVHWLANASCAPLKERPRAARWPPPSENSSPRVRMMLTSFGGERGRDCRLRFALLSTPRSRH
jgi:hypothetical protein